MMQKTMRIVSIWKFSKLVEDEQSYCKYTGILAFNVAIDGEQ